MFSIWLVLMKVFMKLSDKIDQRLMFGTSAAMYVFGMALLAVTRILVPSGTVFREQNIILAPAGEDSMPRS